MTGPSRLKTCTWSWACGGNKAVRPGKAGGAPMILEVNAEGVIIVKTVIKWH